MKLSTFIRPFLVKNKFTIGSILVVSMLTSIASLLLPLSIGKFMELMFSAGKVKTRALHVIGIHLPDSFTIFFLFFGILLLFKFISSWWTNYKSALLGAFFVSHLRNDLFKSQLRRKNNGVKIDASDLLSYTNEARVLQNYLMKGLVGFVKDLLFLSMALFVLFRIDYLLTTVLVLVLTAFFFLQKIYNNWQKTVFQNKRNQLASLINHVTKTLVISKKQRPDAYDRFIEKSNRYNKSLYSYHISTAFLKSLTPLMVYAALGGVMFTMYLTKNPARTSTGDTVAYLLLLMNTFSTLRNIIRIDHIWVQGGLSARKYTSLKNDQGAKNIIEPETPNSGENSTTIVSEETSFAQQSRLVEY